MKSLIEFSKRRLAFALAQAELNKTADPEFTKAWEKYAKQLEAYIAKLDNRPSA